MAKETKRVITLEADVTFKNQDDEQPEVVFNGYSGAAVNLSSYGFDAPVVYDLQGIETPNVVPLLYRHDEEVGHTESISTSEKGLSGVGKLSIPNARSQEIKGGLKNGFPYQGSMGLQIPNMQGSLKYYKNGTSINGRTFDGPVYVFHNSVLKEMTITPFGRDSNTSFKLLNEDELMEIKNSVEDPQTPVTPPAEPVLDVKNDTTPEVPATPAPEAPNLLEKVFRAQRLLNSHPQHIDIIENGIKDGWDDERITNAIKLKEYETNTPSPPQKKTEGQQRHDLFEARVMLSYGVAPESIEKIYGEKIANEANDMIEMSVVEQLVYCARVEGGNYSGFSDVENMCGYLKNSGFGNLDLPNLLKRTANTLMEERWALNPPFATRYLKEESNKDFRKTERRRVTGGEMWTGLNHDGKIDMYTPGKDTYYETELDTVAKIFMMTREDVVNDDQGALRDMMDAMVEGAMMVPDYKLGKLMLKDAAAGSFWVNADNSFTSTGLTRANLSTQYKAVRQYNEARGGINWNTILDSRWVLVTSVNGEEGAWDIVKQDRIVQETGAANGTKTGDKNYWFGRLDLATFPHMSNSIFGSGSFVSENTWMLWPSNTRYAPFSITYLRGRKRPTIEAVTMPADMLGRGIRGYWDVNVNERERTAIVRCVS